MTVADRSGHAILRLLGWRVAAARPLPDKCVIVGAPHTSNWDLVYGLALAAAVGIRIHWIGKNTLFKGPLGVLIRLSGGIPVDREHHLGAVEQVAEQLETSDRMHLVVAPEGTRGRAECWRSGFYWIAREARVPIVLAYLDHATRRAGMGPQLDSSLPLAEVMAEARRFYSGMEGKRAGRFGPVRPA